jgi:hypothetical protein
VVRAGVDEGGVWGVRQLGGVVHGVRCPRQATVYADETCNRSTIHLATYTSRVRNVSETVGMS